MSVTTVNKLLETVAAARAPGALSTRWAGAWPEPAGEPPAGLEARVIQTHFRPAGPARLVFEGVVPDLRKNKTKRQYLYLQVYPSGQRSARRAAAALSGKRALKCIGPAAFEIEEWNAVVWALPNGPRLRVVRSFLRNKPFRRFTERIGLRQEAGEARFSHPSLIRYVPRHRAVLRWDRQIGGQVSSSYIKLFRPGDDEVAAANLRRASDLAESSGSSFFAPALIAHDAHRRAIVMQGLSGETFTGRIGRAHEPSFAAVGRALAGLHKQTTPTRVRWSAAEHVVRMSKGTADLAQALPAWRGKIEDLMGRLREAAERVSFDEGAVIHGNLFGDQILCGADGRVGIVDWDDLSSGDPTYDVGRLIAHVIFVALASRRSPGEIEACIAALLGSYRAAGGPRLSAQSLGWHTAASLLMRGKISALRPLVDGWEDLLVATVHESSRVLAWESGWIPAEAVL